MQGRVRTVVMVLMCLASRQVPAQLRLPQLPLPALPGQVVPQTLADVEQGRLPGLAELRHLRLRELVRANRRIIETDPDGNPVVRSEILALPSNPSLLPQIRSLGFSVSREDILADPDSKLLVLSVPPDSSTRTALKQLRALDATGTYDYNHLYTSTGDGLAGVATSVAPGVQPAAVATAAAPRRIGLLDTGIDLTHPAFRGSVIRAWGCEGRSVPAAHGTAVASLLVGSAAVFHGVQPGAQLYSADVYCGLPTGGAADVIVAAIGWMLRERVPVINVSLVGPRNALLESVLRVAIHRGHVIVAAVGNDGPSAPPLYPAAYAGVIGVTGVDARRHVLFEAVRGPQVSFAAPGAQMAAAEPGGGYAEMRGTSFAAPIVAALVAGLLFEPDTTAAGAAVEILVNDAVDLGPAGKDFTYGYGLVGETFRIDPRELINK